MKLCRLILVALLAAPAAALAGEGPPLEPKEKPGEEQPVVDEELRARIRNLVEGLGDEDYGVREAAGKALLKIGAPARPALEKATRDQDAERSERAKELLRKLPRPGDVKKVDPNCTNGYMPVYGEFKQVQTFKVAADLEIDDFRFRAARCHLVPGALTIELREVGGKKDAEPLASAEFEQEWTGADGRKRGVTRYMRWLKVAAKVKLKKGKTYKLVFSSEGSGATNPWLINCFYRDVFKAGEHTRYDGEDAEKPGRFDLAFQLRLKETVKLTSVPAKLDLSKRELFGIGHDGADLSKPQARDDILQMREGFL